MDCWPGIILGASIVVMLVARVFFSSTSTCAADGTYAMCAVAHDLRSIVSFALGAMICGLVSRMAEPEEDAPQDDEERNQAGSLIPISCGLFYTRPVVES